MSQETITAYDLEVLQQKAKAALDELRQSFEASIEYIDEINSDFAKYGIVNAVGRPMYLSCEDQLKYLFHDWSNLDAGFQNEEIFRWLKAIKEYRNALVEYKEQFSRPNQN